MTFLVAHVVPADPALLVAGPNASEEQVKRIRQEQGLDRPLYVQYMRYLQGLFHADLGVSVRTRRPVVEELAQFAPATLELILVTLLLYAFWGVLGGVLTAYLRGRFGDDAIRFAAVASAAVPPFWLAIMFQVVFFGRLGWFPSIGRIGAHIIAPPRLTGMFLLDSVIARDWLAFTSALWHIALPSLTLFLGSVAILIRVTRRGLIETLQQDYIQTARAKGLSRRSIVWKHALPNTLLPIITLIGLQFGWFLNGTVLVEVVFSWPGIGQYAVTAAHFLDFPAIMGVALFVAIVFTLINLFVDVGYALADPRVRYGGEEGLPG